MEKVEFKVFISILKPIADVFDAVISPKKLSGYFTQTASGPLREGEQVFWRFPEFEEEFPVTVHKVIPNQMIRLEWKQEEGYNTQVDMHFEALDSNSTLVSITESGWHPDEQGIKKSYGNCMGWTHMLCSLKAFLEYGINFKERFIFENGLLLIPNE